MNLSEHFTDHELGVENPGELRLVQNAAYLCRTILEPIRAKFGPVRIHDGYRSPEHNAAVGGKPTSYHQFEGGKAAADFDCTAAGFQQVFDWIRLESGLPFDKVILEHNTTNEPRAIHIQVDSSAPPRRFAYLGSTGAGTVYTPMEVV